MTFLAIVGIRLTDWKVKERAERIEDNTLSIANKENTLL